MHHDNNNTDSETFDLAGKQASTIEPAIRQAFATPFSLSETIRITFVTGAGKLARQKYDEGAAKAITAPLRDLGYTEDAGGGPGTFKLQHDTGKNLKTVVVHPQLEASVTDITNSAANLSLGTSASSSSLVPPDSPQHKIAYASTAVFERMITSMCLTWSQKKACIGALDELKELITGLDQKLLTGTPLTETEQTFYDDVSLSSLEAKQTTVRELMHQQVDKGQITVAERTQLLEQVQERIQKLQHDKEQAEQGNAPKKVQQLTTALTKAQERRDKLQQTTGRPPPPLKKQAEIQTLRVELKPLLQLQASSKGRLLSVKETQALARKEEIDEEIQQLEQASRGWFESDDAFERRVEISRAAFAAQQQQQSKAKATKKPTTSSTTTSRTSAVTGAWASTTRKKNMGGSKAKPPSAKPKGAGGVFAAMMMDSDSD